MASNTGGVKAFSIQGRLYRERERLHGNGMTEEEREWRKRWLKDQQLSPCEPRFVPELHKELYNPIRRAYWKPLDGIFNSLKPFIGVETANVSRKLTGKLLMGIAAIYMAAYYFKYNQNDWTRKGGWRVYQNRAKCLPGEVGFGETPREVIGSNYSTRGFNKCPI